MIEERGAKCLSMYAREMNGYEGRSWSGAQTGDWEGGISTTLIFSRRCTAYSLKV